MKEAIRSREIRFQTDPTVAGKVLEPHHIVQKHNGGDSHLQNLFSLTKAEHAYMHFLEATLADVPKERNVNLWAVNAIQERMSQSELREFNVMLMKRELRQSRP
jgi:hypothetical protein